MGSVLRTKHLIAWAGTPFGQGRRTNRSPQGLILGEWRHPAVPGDQPTRIALTARPLPTFKK